MSYYYDNREPGVGKLAGAGTLVGLCASILITSIVALSQWLAGAQIGEVLNWSLQLLLLLSVLCSSLGALMALIYYTRRLMPLAPKEEVEDIYVDPHPAQQATKEEGQFEDRSDTLAEQVVANVYEQVVWYYDRDQNPSRRAMEEKGVSQAIWNSARTVLREAGMLHEDVWIDRAETSKRLTRIHPEGNKIWVPNERGLKALVVGKLVGNSYISTPPHQQEGSFINENH